MWKFQPENFSILLNNQNLPVTDVCCHISILSSETASTSWSADGTFWHLAACVSTSAITYPCAFLMLACHCDICRMFFKIQKCIVKISWHKLEDELGDLISVLYYVKFMAWLLHNSLFIPPSFHSHPPKKTQTNPKTLKQQQQHKPNNNNKEKEKKEEVYLMKKTWSLGTLKTPSNLYLL